MISSRPPAATRTPNRARIAEVAAASHNAAPKSLPSIAHTARKAMSQMIAKADKLASLGASAAELDSNGQSALPSASMIAPAFTQRGISTDTFETRTFAAPVAPKAILRSHSVVRNLHASQVPALRRAYGAPLIANLNPGSRNVLSLIRSAGKLEAGPGGALDMGSEGDALKPDASVPTMPQVAAPRQAEQLKAKTPAPAALKAVKPMPAKAVKTVAVPVAKVVTPVQIASSNLGPSSADKATTEALGAITSASPQKAADKFRAKAAERKSIVKPITAKKSAVAAHIPAVAPSGF